MGGCALLGGCSLSCRLCLLLVFLMLRLCSVLVLREWALRSSLPMREGGRVLPLMRSSRVRQMILGLGWERDIVVSYAAAIIRSSCYCLMQLRALRPAQLRHYHTEPNKDRQSAQSEHPPLIRAPSPLPTPLSRSVPKQMVQDREALYHDVLLLKQHINKLTDDNQRLRTKVMMLEGERGKAARLIQQEAIYFRLMKRDKNPPRINESMVTQGLRRIAEQCRQKLQAAQAENKRLKKTAKYAKIHQLELTCNVYLTQNQRLAGLLAEARKLQEQQVPEQAVEQEKKMRRRAEEMARKMEEQFRQAEAGLMQAEERLKKEVEGYGRKERKWQNELALERRKTGESQTQCEQLRRVIEGRREGSEHAGNPKFNRSLYPRRELPNNPLFKNSIPSTHTRSVQSEQNAKLRAENQALKQQLLHKQITKVEEDEQEESLRNTRGKKQEEDRSAIEEKPTAERQSTVEKQPTVERHNVQLAVETPTKKKYKPDKAMLGEIKELLTMRMAAQQFAFAEMKADIERAGAESFSYADLCEMLVSEPFFLTVEYSRTALTYFFENPRPSKDSELPTATLIAKLRKLIADVPLSSNHEATLQRCIQTITQHKSKLRKQLPQSTTVTRQQLQSILSELGLSSIQRELVLGEVSLFSANLRQLDCDSLFERFTLD